MAVDTLEFEEPVAILLKEIEALSLMPQTAERLESIEQLDARVVELRSEIFSKLTPWQVVLVARHANRPCTLDYLEKLFTDFTELHGDRRFADDAAIVAGLAQFHGRPVIVEWTITDSNSFASGGCFLPPIGMVNPPGVERRTGA